MAETMQIPKGECETVRVFVIDVPPEEARALMDDPPGNGAPSPLARLFGLDRLDRGQVEVFPAEDVRGVGLAGYLTEGMGVDEAEVAPVAATLNAATGHVVILRPEAFGGEETALRPQPPLRHLGTFRLTQAAPPVLTPPAAPGDSAAAAPAGPARAPAGPPARIPRSLGLIALLAAAVLVLLVAWLIGSR